MGRSLLTPAGEGTCCGRVVLFIVLSLQRDGHCDGRRRGMRGRKGEGWQKGEGEDGRLRLESEMKEDMKWKETE